MAPTKAATRTHPLGGINQGVPAAIPQPAFRQGAIWGPPPRPPNQNADETPGVAPEGLWLDTPYGATWCSSAGPSHPRGFLGAFEALLYEVEARRLDAWCQGLSLIHISEPTRQEAISYAVFCLKKKKKE